MFIPIPTANPPVLKGTGNKTAPIGTRTNDKYLGSDGSHLYQAAGNENSGGRIYGSLLSQLVAMERSSSG